MFHSINKETQVNQHQVAVSCAQPEQIRVSTEILHGHYANLRLTGSWMCALTAALKPVVQD